MPYASQASRLSPDQMPYEPGHGRRRRPHGGRQSSTFIKYSEHDLDHTQTGDPLMGKNWAKIGAKAALLAAGLVVAGTGAANAGTIDTSQLTGPVNGVVDTVGQAAGNTSGMPGTPLKMRRADGPTPVLPGSPVQSSAVNTAPALAALEIAKQSVTENAPGGTAAADGLDKAEKAVSDAVANGPQALAKKREGSPIPGVSDKSISIPPDPNDPGNLGTPVDVGTPLDKVGDPSQAIGGAVQGVTSKLGADGLAGQ